MIKKILMLGLVFLISLIAVNALPVSVDTVQVDGVSMILNDVNRLDLQRGDQIQVKVRLTADAPVSNMEITAFISGYEYDTYEPISDTTDLFDLDAQSSVVKRLTLTIPDRVEKDDYRLRILVADRNGEPIVQNYRIAITAPRHNVMIRDVLFNPEDKVVAGRSLLVSVRVKNLGDRDEDGVRVRVTIPDLDISASDFIDNLEIDETKTSEELFLRIPVCAKAGNYPVEVEVEYSDGYKISTATEYITVTSDGSTCNQFGPTPTPTEPQSQAKTSFDISPDTLNLKVGEVGSSFSITITNPSSVSRSYTLSTEGITSADARFSPSNLILVDGGETTTASLYITPKSTAKAGENTFNLLIQDSDGKTLKSVPLSIVIKAGAKTPSTGAEISPDLQRWLEIGAVVLFVILIIVGLILLFTKMSAPPEEPRTYY